MNDRNPRFTPVLPSSMISGAPLPPDMKAQATLLIRALAERVNQQAGQTLYPAVERIEVVGMEFRDDGVSFKIGWREPVGGNLILGTAARPE